MGKGFGSEVVVRQAAAVAVDFEPVVEEGLVQVRGHDLLAQLMGFDAEKRHPQSRQRSDQRLRDSVWAHRTMFMAGLHLAQRGGYDQQALRVATHFLQAANERRSLNRKGLHQVPQIFSLDRARLFQPRYRVVAQPERLFLHSGKPAVKASKREWVLLARVRN